MRDNNNDNMHDIDTTEEVRIRNNFGINNSVQNDGEDYSVIYQNDARSLSINGNDKMLGGYHIEIVNNRDNYSKISFSLKTDTDLNFFEYARQDDHFSLYDYSYNDEERILKTAQSVLDTNCIENDAKYTMIKLDKDESNNYPIYGYENFGSRGAIIGMANESFKENLSILNAIIEQINLKNNFDITSRVFDSIAVQELEQSKTKKLK